MTDAEITALAHVLDIVDESYPLSTHNARIAATALRALLAERERLRGAMQPFIDLAVATTVEGSPDYREWVGQANDWTIALSFAGRSITLGQLRALSAPAPKEPDHG